MLSKPLVAAIAAALCASSAALVQDGAVEIVRESATKVEFPVVRSALGPRADVPGGPQHLTGTAVRDKTIFGVDVYAYGLYVDPWVAQERLAAFDDHSAKALGKDAAFYDALMAPELPKTLRLVFVRNVDADDVVEAFEGSLEPRIAKAVKERELPDATADLEAFKAFFDLAKLRKGNELVFSWVGGDTLRTAVNGELKPELVSPGLCWALFDVYLGADPIEESGKKKLAARVPGILDAELPPRPPRPAEPADGR